MRLAVFGPDRYPVLIGRIALPNLMAQAAAPAIGAGLLSVLGLNGALVAFTAAAACNVVMAACLMLAPPGRYRPRKKERFRANFLGYPAPVFVELDREKRCAHKCRMKIGYARVSTDEQNLALRLDALRATAVRSSTMTRPCPVQP